MCIQKKIIIFNQKRYFLVGSNNPNCLQSWNSKTLLINLLTFGQFSISRSFEYTYQYCTNLYTLSQYRHLIFLNIQNNIFLMYWFKGLRFLEPCEFHLKKTTNINKLITNNINFSPTLNFPLIMINYMNIYIIIE